MKSLLVDRFPMRPGRSKSPGTFLSNLIWLFTMPRCRRHVTEGRMAALLVVMMYESRNDRFGLQIILAIVVIAFSAHGTIETLDDAVQLGVSGFRLDLDQVVGFDHCRDIAVDELAPWSWMTRGVAF